MCEIYDNLSTPQHFRNIEYLKKKVKHFVFYEDSLVLYFISIDIPL